MIFNLEWPEDLGDEEGDKEEEEDRQVFMRVWEDPKEPPADDTWIWQR